MRKTIFVIIFLFASIDTFAQAGRMVFGYEKGLSLVSARGNSILENLEKAKISFSAGIFGQYAINKNFAVKAILSFERKAYSPGTRADG